MKPARHAFPLRLAMALSLLVPALPASAEELYSDRGFFIDLPEGFSLQESDGATRFSFLSPDGYLTVDVLVYEPARFASARAGADASIKKLGAKGSPASFRYAGLDAALGEISWGSGAQAVRAVAFFLNDALSPSGGASAAASYDLAIIAHAPASAWPTLRETALSAVDGFSADAARRAAPGPVGAAARAALGAAKPVPAELAFGQARIAVNWDPREAAIAQELVEREYRVLLPYGAAPELVEAAIQRFYRMVWRDSAPSLDALALQLSAAWETGAWSGEDAFRRVETPDAEAVATSSGQGGAPSFGIPADPRAYAEALLAWSQGWIYERDPDGSDVVNPLSAAMEGRGDCDSRAMVLSILLRRENIEAILMVSLVHEHALLAADLPGAGARYPFGDRAWLVGETTARVSMGKIDASQADPEDWIGVAFPF